MTNTELDQQYIFENMPMDAADTDPRWADISDLYSTVFLDERPDDSSVKKDRLGFQKSDHAHIVITRTRQPQLIGDRVVAAIATRQAEINVGNSWLPCGLVSGVGVRPPHKRRGLLRRLMTDALQRMQNKGMPLAILTASSAQLYGRYGFAPACRLQCIEMAINAFKLRPGVPVAGGNVVMCNPSDLEDSYYRLARAQAERRPGGVTHSLEDLTSNLGIESQGYGKANRAMRAMAYLDDDGVIQGFVTYWMVKSSPSKTWSDQLRIAMLCAPDAEIELRLWSEVARVELIDHIAWKMAPLDSLLPLALADPRAYKVQKEHDYGWLRILDVVKALEMRGYGADGQVLLDVNDDMCLTGGTYELLAKGGCGRVQRVDSSYGSAVHLGMEELAMLYLGDRSVYEMAAIGRISGPPEALQTAHRLFATHTKPYMQSDF